MSLAQRESEKTPGQNEGLDWGDLDLSWDTRLSDQKHPDLVNTTNTAELEHSVYNRDLMRQDYRTLYWCLYIKVKQNISVTDLAYMQVYIVIWVIKI